MSIKTKACHIACCDDCGQEYEHDYTPHWPSATEALDDVINNADWWGDEKLLLCAGCRDKPHAIVPDGNCCSRCGIAADDHESPTAAVTS